VLFANILKYATVFPLQNEFSMLKTFRFSLIFSILIFLGLCGSAFAQDKNDGSDIHKTSWSTPLLTKQQIVDGFDTGINTGATHMLIVWDTWNFEDSYDFIVYSYPGEDVNDLIKYYDAPGFYKVSAVFAMHLDFNQQLSDKRWYPEYP
jgi:hypothetical protein